MLLVCGVNIEQTQYVKPGVGQPLHTLLSSLSETSFILPYRLPLSIFWDHSVIMDAIFREHP